MAATAPARRNRFTSTIMSRWTTHAHKANTLSGILPISARGRDSRTARSSRWPVAGFEKTVLGDGEPLIGTAHLIARIAVGAALGGVIGYERDRHRRPVGLRTHLIVAMASATFTVLSSQFVYWQYYGKDDLVEVDTTRMAASIVSAVGFLAGGAILRTGITVQGLTTAAGLWLVTAIGMCAGAGMYLVSIAVTAMGIVALTVLRRFEDKNDHVLRRRVSVVLGDEEPGIGSVMSALTALGAIVADVEYERRLDDDKKRMVATFDVSFADTLSLTKLIEAIESVPGVRRVRIQHHV
jgi:putative Mg2+ transporter-C (MgtC) family protein